MHFFWLCLRPCGWSGAALWSLVSPSSSLKNTPPSTRQDGLNSALNWHPRRLYVYSACMYRNCWQKNLFDHLVESLSFQTCWWHRPVPGWFSRGTSVWSPDGTNIRLYHCQTIPQQQSVRQVLVRATRQSYRIYSRWEASFDVCNQW